MPTLVAERQLWRSGHRTVAGIDEVGRGAWAGPVSVGVAVVPTDADDAAVPSRLRDSKALPEARREALFEPIGQWCAAWAVGHATPLECDRLGMTAALRLAAGRALDGLAVVPDAVLLDGPHDYLAPGGDEPRCTPATVLPITGGDAHCVSIAAASVLAKVVRDRLMRGEAASFPAFCFEQNKGYPSPAHRRALRGYGVTSIHRRSWSYVAELPWAPWPVDALSPATATPRG